MKLLDASCLRPGLIACLALICPAMGSAADRAGTSTPPGYIEPAAQAAEAPVPSGEAFADTWARLRQGFRIDDTADAHPLLAQHLAWHAARPDHMRRVSERARFYLHYLVEEIERRSMPMEIALLPMIESAFIPTALSPSAAAGIWQFIPSTGQYYGLRQDTWYDGRRDFIAATQAALDYLGKLYLDFGDWQLAFAAYNCGEGCVARAIERNVAAGLPTDYANLPLPAETRHYVPKLLAVRQVIRTPERFAVTLAPVPNSPYFEQVSLHMPLDIPAAARLANVDTEKFLALNAAFPRQVIRSDTPVNLLLPVGRADMFQRNLESGDWDSWQPYTVQRGERPEAIARRLDVPLNRLEAHNQFNLRQGRFAQTQTILVPRRRQATSKPVGQTDVVVQPGDTLFRIAQQHGLTLAQLVAANPGVGQAIRPGMQLTLPVETAPRHYTVKPGDSLFAIARALGLPIDDLKRWNPSLAHTTTLRPGQQLSLQQP